MKTVSLLPFPLTALLLAPGCGRATVRAPSGPSAPAPAALLEGWVGDLGSPGAEDRSRAAGRLRAEGERSLPLLEKAAAGTGVGASRARLLLSRIVADLTEAERKADEAYLASEAGAVALASLPRGSWVLVAGGKLAASGATREAALSLDRTPSARHRFLWRLGEPAADRVVEMSSLSAGDLGAAARRALGDGEIVLGVPDGGTEARMPGSGAEDWPDCAVALAEPEALRLGLARWSIPGRIEARSRLGAGRIAGAWRARVWARSADSNRSCDIEVWVIPGEDRP